MEIAELLFQEGNESEELMDSMMGQNDKVGVVSENQKLMAWWACLNGHLEVVELFGDSISTIKFEGMISIIIKMNTLLIENNRRYYTIALSSMGSTPILGRVFG